MIVNGIAAIRLKSAIADCYEVFHWLFEGQMTCYSVNSLEVGSKSFMRDTVTGGRPQQATFDSVHHGVYRKVNFPCFTCYIHVFVQCILICRA